MNEDTHVDPQIKVKALQALLGHGLEVEEGDRLVDGSREYIGKLGNWRIKPSGYLQWEVTCVKNVSDYFVYGLLEQHSQWFVRKLGQGYDSSGSKRAFELIMNGTWFLVVNGEVGLSTFISAVGQLIA